MKRIKNMRTKMEKGYVKASSLLNKGLKEITDRSKEALNNEGGFTTGEWITMGAIVFLALFALKTPIETFFSNIWSAAATFFEGKLSELFS